ncbi:MAG: ABC transporter substrate-binding protein [Acutalibacteraceae bacterium]
MKRLTRAVSLLLCAVMLLSFAACAGKTGDSATTTEEPLQADTTPINITALKGPTGMGMAKLMNDGNEQYNFSIAAAATDIAPLIINGEADIAACPLNLAATLYKKTNGQIKMIAINTLGVLYIVENGNSINSIADLKGKTIGATGQGATPEYVLNYLLRANGLEPGNDVTIEYFNDHSELATRIASGKIDIAMLPEPNVTTVLVKNSSLRKAIDLTEEWEKTTEANGEKTSLAQGCLIVRTEFLEAHPNAVKAFLAAYKESVDFVNNNSSQAAQMIADAGIVPSAQIAEQAIPNCNIVYMVSDDMVQTAKANFEVLFKADPASIGGAMPDDNLYYTGE